ncbi:MAG: diaminopimelate epimerase [Actinomycetota bacterium]|nr:diaminopimelate epimerase [Actinomycetota bacterium]
MIMLEFVKGHGTENDFVLLPDPHGAIELTVPLVRALCDRRSGIGADGVLRVVPDRGRQGGWFMDYRNADGSTAQMCGNGIRVYARYLVDAGLAAAGDLELGTRDGPRRVRLGRTGDVTVDMGPAQIAGESSAEISGRRLPGVCVSMGNPHLVCVVPGGLSGYDLSHPPDVDRTAFPDGVNVELVAHLGERHVAMRVHERGVGETRSCGTGACAAVVAVAARAPAGDGEWTVDVPGGRLAVHLAGGGASLSGPAVIVGGGTLDENWLSAV